MCIQHQSSALIEETAARVVVVERDRQIPSYDGDITFTADTDAGVVLFGTEPSH